MNYLFNEIEFSAGTNFYISLDKYETLSLRPYFLPIGDSAWLICSCYATFSSIDDSMEEYITNS